jgi:ethanolamine ammonia-lyase large subunit
MGVLDEAGRPGDHFGDPHWMYFQYKLAKRDKRDQIDIIQEAKAMFERVRSHGVLIAEGHDGSDFASPPKDLDAHVRYFP